MDIKQRVRDILREKITDPFTQEDMINLIKEQGVKEATIIKWKLQLELLRHSLPNLVEDMVEDPLSLCPYCYYYKYCGACPVKEKTGKSYCEDTTHTEFLFSLRRYTNNPTYFNQRAVIKRCKIVLGFIRSL